MMKTLAVFISFTGAVLLITGMPGLSGQSMSTGQPPFSVPEYSYKVVHAYPHDTSAFTQGLVYL
ncbi:MAG TPA: glutaminyl-peptide cyclotransferase, partial [Anaerolineales bacterium]|nr:glutaminyl-peptide cyclotransferase [Anaerolineales bacterium]